MGPILHRSLLQLTALRAPGRTSAAALAEDTTAAIVAAKDPAVFTAVPAERARREGRPSSLLDGIPVAWKDLVDVALVRRLAAERIIRGDAGRDRSGLQSLFGCD